MRERKRERNRERERERERQREREREREREQKRDGDQNNAFLTSGYFVTFKKFKVLMITYSIL